MELWNTYFWCASLLEAQQANINLFFFTYFFLIMQRKGETARSLSLLSRSRNNEKFDLQVLGLPFTMCFNFSPNWIRIAYSQLH